MAYAFEAFEMFYHIHNCIVLTIGFEHTSLAVNENAGPVSVCVRILQPRSPTAAIENTHYSVALTTDFRPGRIINI